MAADQLEVWENAQMGIAIARHDHARTLAAMRIDHACRYCSPPGTRFVHELQAMIGQVEHGMPMTEITRSARRTIVPGIA
jgi:hypothetical protein